MSLLKLTEETADNSNLTKERDISSPFVEGESVQQLNQAPVQGERNPNLNQNTDPLQEESDHTTNSQQNQEPLVESVNDSNEDAGNASELEETVSPNDNDYDENYPPLAKWTRVYPQR